MSILEKVAREIARIRGDDFDYIPVNKSDWTKQQGKFQGRFRDVNEPFQSDYLEMANVSITAFLEAAAAKGWHMRPDEATEAMQEAGMGEDGPNWPDPAWRGMCKISPPFDWDK